MLIFGDHNCLPANVNIDSPIKVFNLSSYIQGYPSLSSLLPNGVGMMHPETFDMGYFDYIFNNDKAFAELMIIISELYNGNSVYLIITHSPFYDTVSESLAEIIKQRYGYISFFINEISDYLYIPRAENTGDFSILGLQNVDNDRMRYVNILESNGLVEIEDYD